jgi:hypothetical protein
MAFYLPKTPRKDFFQPKTTNYFPITSKKSLKHPYRNNFHQLAWCSLAQQQKSKASSRISANSTNPFPQLCCKI